jgi:hypothetical protein
VGQTFSLTPLLEWDFSHSCLLLNLTGPNCAATGDAEKTQNRQTDRQKVGARCVGHSGRDIQPSLLLFSIILFIYFASFLYLYSLRPFSFTIL